MILAIVTEEVDERGRRRYVATLAQIVDEDEEKPYGMLALEPTWRAWTHKEIAILVANRADLDKAAKILGRTKESCSKKLYRLGLLMGVNLKKESAKIMMVFPKEYVDRRKAIIKQAMPRLKKLLRKVDKLEDLDPETINSLSKVVRAMASLFNAVEKWESGEEMLKIWAHEVEEEEGEELEDAPSKSGKG